jgi:hypothetical protein
MPIALAVRVVVLFLMAEIPSTHCVKSDDVHIAYQVLGQGSFDLVFVPGLCQTSKGYGNRWNRAHFFGALHRSRG